jgi:acyl carrier protein
MSDITAKVKAIIVDKLGVDESEVTPEASFTNDLGADSLDTVELIMEFEKEFDIAIPDDQAEKTARLARLLPTSKTIPSKYQGTLAEPFRSLSCTFLIKTM